MGWGWETAEKASRASLNSSCSNTALPTGTCFFSLLHWSCSFPTPNKSCLPCPRGGSVLVSQVWPGPTQKSQSCFEFLPPPPLQSEDILLVHSQGPTPEAFVCWLELLNKGDLSLAREFPYLALTCNAGGLPECPTPYSPLRTVNLKLGLAIPKGFLKLSVLGFCRRGNRPGMRPFSPQFWVKSPLQGIQSQPTLTTALPLLSLLPPLLAAFLGCQGPTLPCPATVDKRSHWRQQVKMQITSLVDCW